MLVAGRWLSVVGWWRGVGGSWWVAAGWWPVVDGCWLAVGGWWPVGHSGPVGGDRSLVAGGRWLVVDW